MLNIRPIPRSEIASFRRKFQDAIFRDERIDAVYQNRLKYFGLYNSTERIGGFVLFEGGRGPLRTLITPPFYPHIGLFVDDAQTPTHEIYASLNRFARGQYVCYLKWDLPLAYYSADLPKYWQERWTYRLHMRQAEASLLKGIHPTIKSSHQKAIKNDCRLVLDPNKDAAMAMIRANLDEKSVRYKSRLLSQLHAYYSEHPQAYYFTTFLGEQRIACNLIYIDNGVAYHLFSAFDRSLSLNYANAAHLLGTILHLKECFPEVHTFDFEGSTIPSIDFYFKRFGGIQCKYPSMYYSRLPLFFKGTT